MYFLHNAESMYYDIQSNIYVIGMYYLYNTESYTVMYKWYLCARYVLFKQHCIILN